MYAAATVGEAQGTALTLEKSVFAPSARLMAAWLSGKMARDRLDREYRAELRASLRANRGLWVDLAEQAALEDMWLVGEITVAEVLWECVVRLGASRGLVLDQSEDELGVAVIESRRRAVLGREGVRRPTDLEEMRAVAPSRGKERYR